MTVKKSKTDRSGSGQVLCIGSTGDTICPVKAMKKYIRARVQLFSPGPLFIWQHGQFFTRSNFTTILQATLDAAGYNGNAFASHSLRIGGATAAAGAGIDEWKIKLLGWWNSDCYKRYVKTAHQSLESTAKELARS